MPIRKEPVNAGLVQNRHALLFRPGELQRADDCILRPGDPAIHRAPGRAVHGVVKSTTITCTTDGTTALTSSTSGFGTDIASVTIEVGNDVLTSAAAFGAVVLGQTVVGTGIPANAFVVEIIDTSNIRISKLPTAGGVETITHCDIHPGTFISGTNIVSGTKIASITDAAALTMDTAATGSTVDSSLAFTERIEGLRPAVFDNQTDLMFAKAADQIYVSPMTGLTGTWTALTSSRGLSQDDDAFLESIQFKNRHIFLTGFDYPRILYYGDDGLGANTIRERPIGMLPVTGFASATAISGSWRTDDGWGAGYYYFLVTEVVILGDNDVIESTFTGDPQYAQITDAATQSIEITYADGNAINAGQFGRNTATHWRIYMAPRNSTDTGPTPAPSLAAYRKVLDVPIATTSFVLSGSNPHQSGFASDIIDPDPAYPDELFPNGASNALGTAALNAIASCTTTADSKTVTSAAAFGSVEVGMSVTSATDNLPYGCKVTAKASSSSITVSHAAVAGTTESLYFGSGQEPWWTLAVAPPNIDTSSPRSALFQDFGIQDIGGFSGATVTGVEISINGKYEGLSGPRLWISLNKGGTGGSYSPERSGEFNDDRRDIAYGVQTSGWIKLGGPGDTWGISWSTSDFIDGAATFGIRIRKDAASVVSSTHEIDSVSVRIYTGNSEVTLDGVPFSVVTLSDQLGTETAGPASGPPPQASTGDIFEGMLLLNDIARPNVIVASLPDKEESFPGLYVLPLESRDKDQITNIKRLGNTCIVGCRTSIKRLNYFPREVDAEFNRGRAYEDLATDHGIVGPRAARLVDMPGRGLILAYLSHDGLRWTDGITTNHLNDDLDWTALIEPTELQNVVLEVYPHLSLLALYYTPDGGSRNTKAMYFSYHPIHMKEGNRLPATGPITVEGASAASIVYEGRWYLFTGHSRLGAAYLEDSGITDATGEAILPAIRTRRFFVGDLGLDGRVERVILVTDADGDGTTGGFTATLYRQNQNETVSAIDSVTDKTTEIGGLVEVFIDNHVETFDIEISKDVFQAADFRLHFLGYEAIPYSQDTSA